MPIFRVYASVMNVYSVRAYSFRILSTRLPDFAYRHPVAQGVLSVQLFEFHYCDVLYLSRPRGYIRVGFSRSAEVLSTQVPLRCGGGQSEARKRSCARHRMQ